MGQTTEDWTHTGNVTFTKQPTFPDGGVTNAKVAAAAAIAYTKLGPGLVHQRISQSGTAVSVTQPIHVCYGATGTLIEFSASSIGIAVGSATVAVDLKKNGSSVLTAVITLDTGNTARIKELAAFSGTALAGGDFLEVVVVATAAGGTIPTGLCIDLILIETPQ